MKPLRTRTHVSLPVPVLLAWSAMQVCTQAAAADTPANVADIEGCRPIQAPAERLLCYDTVADGGVFNEQKLQQAQAESFGSRSKEFEVAADRLAVTVVKMEAGQRGPRYVHTADGQVWQQQGSLRWNSRVPFEAEIVPGALGSFFLTPEGTRLRVRVKRVR